ncbi:ABC transporter permease [Ammoniphilus sp. 3BR4]|uniref:ABC transporter permease n=1 Tax=Ammoniphilus sp. 3BR4 TaxID=3158265 RepID=UPI0034658EA3
MGKLNNVLISILETRKIIFELSKNDIKTRYLGSYLGILWALVNPILTILIFWFVFEIGFRSKPIDNYPFIVWLMAGIIPWFFVAESLNGGTNSIVENSFLVKKVVFRVSLLPIIKVFSALVFHMFFLVLLIIVLLMYGYKPDFYSLQVFYYLFSSFIFVVAITWITSSLTVFLRDIGQLVAMLLQFGFWLSPIVWSLDIIPTEYRSFLRYNPAYYIVEGYRNSFIYHKWFWHDISMTVYFWSVTIILLIIGVVMFKRLKPHFADVL